VARPSIGVVTNVGVAHMELFGSPGALRAAKAELPEALPPDGWAVLNADDAVVRSYAGRTAARTVLYGSSAGAAVRCEETSIDRRTGRASFDLAIEGDRARLRLPVPGEHIVPDALAAAAVGWVLGIGIAETATALAGAEMSAGRMDVLDGPDGVRIVDDAYNANPASMAAALRAARWMADDGRCIAVLGHMAELGPIAPDEHRRIGELVARLGIDQLVTVGPEADRIAVGASREGVEDERIHRTADADEAVDVVRTLLRPGDIVLVKASRVARLDRVAKRLAETHDEGAGPLKGIVA
jgi:UDP-N-acetylmuramoyl-tripeptide--D-alanyl-D-alanine ligase